MILLYGFIYLVTLVLCVTISVRLLFLNIIERIRKACGCPREEFYVTCAFFSFLAIMTAVIGAMILKPFLN
jgi:hypothetical protein